MQNALKRNLARVRSMVRRLALPRAERTSDRFGAIYRENLFEGTESRSGTGSTLEQTVAIRRELPALLSRIGARSFMDAPCGDCHWISELDWTAVDYLGVDVVGDLIRSNTERWGGRGMKFLAADLCADPLPRTDVIFCRDCWVHLPDKMVLRCLENFRRSGSTYLLTTTFVGRRANRDLRGAIWRPLNLQARPFSFPRPLEVLTEGCTEDGGKYADKSLGLWRLSDLVA